MGREGIGYITDNCSRLCDFCEENDLVIADKIFQHEIHKATWKSPDGIYAPTRSTCHLDRDVYCIK